MLLLVCAHKITLNLCQKVADTEKIIIFVKSATTARIWHIL